MTGADFLISAAFYAELMDGNHQGIHLSAKRFHKGHAPLKSPKKQKPALIVRLKPTTRITCVLKARSLNTAPPG